MLALHERKLHGVASHTSGAGSSFGGVGSDGEAGAEAEGEEGAAAGAAVPESGVGAGAGAGSTLGCAIDLDGESGAFHMRSSRPAEGAPPNGNSAAEHPGVPPASGVPAASGGAAPSTEGEPSGGVERSPTQLVVDGWRREWRRHGGGGEAEGAELEERFRQQCLRKEIGGKV
eukprot:scaffold29673_cov24-Phaeocystis_antarctica.AAC.2